MLQLQRICSWIVRPTVVLHTSWLAVFWLGLPGLWAAVRLRVCIKTSIMIQLNVEALHQAPPVYVQCAITRDRVVGK
jgi:hypothetical protein